jgi:hypothetical protein
MPVYEKPEWYDVDAAWDALGYASEKLMRLGESDLWLDLVDEVSKNTHVTAEEVWDGMAAAIRGYLQGLGVSRPEESHRESSGKDARTSELENLCINYYETLSFAAKLGGVKKGAIEFWLESVYMPEMKRLGLLGACEKAEGIMSAILQETGFFGNEDQCQNADEETAAKAPASSGVYAHEGLKTDEAAD